MLELLLLLGAALLVNNFVLVQLLGLCPFMGVSHRLDTAVPMGIATIFVISLSTLITNFINTHLLEQFDLQYLRIIVYITVIASVVQLTERYIRFASPLLHQLMGIYLPLITSNCAILGVALSVADYALPQALAVGVGAGSGFTLVLVLFAGLRTRLDDNSIPQPFRGAPIALITVGIMAVAFYGFKGAL